MRKIARNIGTAFLVLCAVSLYRQLCRNYFPADRVYPFVVYAVYAALIVWWWITLRGRITQKSMRRFLYAEAFFMLLWVTTRFVQEAFLQRNLYLLRVTGYLISIPLAMLPLMGLYAALGLGRAEEYRVPGAWFLLLLPAAAQIALMLTNEQHHFVFRSLAGEAPVNLYFHPNVGIYLLLGWAFLLETARLALIWWRGRAMGGHPHRKAIPFVIAAFLALFIAPYFVSSFVVKLELIEFSAGVFFVEAMIWESCILLGMVPVNSQYGMVFDRSTVAMQIVTETGETLLQSSRAPKLEGGLFQRLKADGTASPEEGVELRLYPIHGGYLVWQKNVAKIRSLIRDLRKGADELEQESALLSEELKTRSEEARIQAQNGIYDRLTEEVGGELSLLRELLKKRETAADKDALFRRICLIGTYIKRRCNLRLLEQESGSLAPEDLALSLRDIIRCLSSMGVETALDVSPSARPGPEFSLLAFDLLEFLLEYERLAPAAVSVTLDGDGAFGVTVRSGNPAPREETGRMNRAGCALSWRDVPGGYRLLLREREA